MTRYWLPVFFSVFPAALSAAIGAAAAKDFALFLLTLLWLYWILRKPEELFQAAQAKRTAIQVEHLHQQQFPQRQRLLTDDSGDSGDSYDDDDDRNSNSNSNSNSDSSTLGLTRSLHEAKRAGASHPREQGNTLLNSLPTSALGPSSGATLPSHKQFLLNSTTTTSTTTSLFVEEAEYPSSHSSRQDSAFSSPTNPQSLDCFDKADALSKLDTSLSSTSTSSSIIAEQLHQRKLHSAAPASKGHVVAKKRSSSSPSKTRQPAKPAEQSDQAHPTNGAVPSAHMSSLSSSLSFSASADGSSGVDLQQALSELQHLERKATVMSLVAPFIGAIGIHFLSQPSEGIFMQLFSARLFLIAAGLPPFVRLWNSWTERATELQQVIERPFADAQAAKDREDALKQEVLALRSELSQVHGEVGQLRQHMDSSLLKVTRILRSSQGAIDTHAQLSTQRLLSLETRLAENEAVIKQGGSVVPHPHDLSWLSLLRWESPSTKLARVLLLLFRK